MTSQLDPPPTADMRVPVYIRHATTARTDLSSVSALVRDYVMQTEREKSHHGAAEASVPSGGLPQRYEREVRDPLGAYAGCTVLMAEADERAVGVVVVRIATGGEAEIKRLWADPVQRGRGVGSGLLDAAIALASGAVRLSVWEWRTSAIRLYESRGFERVASWESRDGLICMMRPSM